MEKKVGDFVYTAWRRFYCVVEWEILEITDGFYKLKAKEYDTVVFKPQTDDTLFDSLQEAQDALQKAKRLDCLKMVLLSIGMPLCIALASALIYAMLCY